MIKFFRNIRFDLMGKNKTGKYLKYAIGEIILVVIGILIALSINSWNQNRLNTIKNSELLQGIVKDLNQDIATLDRAIEFYEKRMAFIERHMQKTDFTTTPTDTLFELFIAATVAFNITDLSYEKAKNLGISKLCSDDSLLFDIDNYYTRNMDFAKLVTQYEIDELNKNDEFWVKGQESLEFDLGTPGQFPIMQDSMERRINAIALITKPRGRNFIKFEYWMKSRMLETRKRNRENARELSKGIEAYLED